MSEFVYHAHSVEENLEALQLDGDAVVRGDDISSLGITSDEAARRLKVVGPNTLPEEEGTPWWKLVFAQLRSFLILILIVAAGISFFLDHATDAYIILAAVFVNVIVGFVQEFRAEKSLAALREVITLQAKAIRDGEQGIIPSEELVPGDVIVLDAGDKVPADARLISLSELETNEAALTGESAEVEKQLEPVHASAGVGDRTNMVFFGTTVTKGSAMALVVHTGTRTEIGRIADLLDQTESDLTPLQKKLNQFARVIGVSVLLLSLVLFLIGLAKGLPFVEIFTTAVAVAVSAIPEGLVVAVTIILAVGMQRILKRQSLVRNLQAAETLGSTSVICTDKTGTLTEGNMRVVSLVTHDYHFKKLGDSEVDRHKDNGLRELIFALNIGMLCNDAHVVSSENELQENVIVGNMTGRALLAAGMNIGLDQDQLKIDEPRIATIPFNSTRKYMATLHEHPEMEKRIYVKGAPERVLEMSSKIRTGADESDFSEDHRDEFIEQFEAYSKNGLRILALAYKNVPSSLRDLREEDVTDLVFVGFVGIKDPLRKDIRETFAITEGAGIRTVMITGDHKLTAQAIARELGLPAEDKNILTGEELHEMTQEELNNVVERISVYARVSPEDKLNIINAWRAKGKVVAMTGDGVNDSPALKAADIGVALGSGTDVAKETADIVLLDDRFSTIVAAVEEGRGIFENLRKVVLYLLSDSFTEVVLVSVALIIGIPVPLTAGQILWINLVADGLPNVALTAEPGEPDSMKEQPRSRTEPILNSEMKLIIGLISVFTAAANLVVFMYYYNTTGDLSLARTIVFTAVAVDSLFYVFSVRSLRHNIFKSKPFSNPWLLAAVAAAFIVQLSAIYFPPLQSVLGTSPLLAEHWLVVGVLSFLVVLCSEIVKYIFIQKKK